MSWKEKLVGATIIYEILIVLPCVLLSGSITDLLSQLFSTSFDWGWFVRILIIIVLNGFYGMGLLLIMGLIDFARRPRKEPISSRIKSMEIGRE